MLVVDLDVIASRLATWRSPQRDCHALPAMTGGGSFYEYEYR